MADFLERVRRGVEKGVTTVGAKSKELIEVTQLRGHISALEAEKRAKLEELGNIVYAMVGRDAIDLERLRQKCRAIAGVDTAIVEKHEQIKAVQAETERVLGGTSRRQIGNCQCGNEIFEGVRFCGRCGAKAPGVS